MSRAAPSDVSLEEFPEKSLQTASGLALTLFWPSRTLVFKLLRDAESPGCPVNRPCPIVARLHHDTILYQNYPSLNLHLVTLIVLPLSLGGALLLDLYLFTNLTATSAGSPADATTTRP